MSIVAIVTQTSTDTPTPTATVTSTATGTATSTPTSTVDPYSVYIYGTMPADGQSVAWIYTFTAGEAAIAGTNLVMILLMMFIVFLLLARRPK